MTNELFEHKRKKLQAQLIAAARDLLQHMGSASALVPLDDGTFIAVAIGTPDAIRQLLEDEKA